MGELDYSLKRSLVKIRYDGTLSDKVNVCFF